MKSYLVIALGVRPAVPDGPWRPGGDKGGGSWGQTIRPPGASPRRSEPLLKLVGGPDAEHSSVWSAAKRGCGATAPWEVPSWSDGPAQTVAEGACPISAADAAAGVSPQRDKINLNVQDGGTLIQMPP